MPAPAPWAVVALPAIHGPCPAGGVTDPVSGAVQAPNCDLNDFNVPGHQANGIWTLTINDICGADVGFLHDWSLGFQCGVQSCMGACQNPPTALVTSNSPVCVGAPINLSEFGGQALAWVWSGPNSFSSFDQNPVIPAAIPANDGTYDVTITDFYNCTSTGTVDVTVHPSLEINGLFDTTVCEWESVLLNTVITGGSGSYSCSWSPSPNLNNPFSCTPSFRSPVAGVYTYTVTVTDNTFGCTATKTITITNQDCCMPSPSGCSACNSQCTMMGTELVVNGDFSGGDTGFTSGLTSNCTCVAGTYCVTTSAINKCINSLWQHIKST